MHENETQDAQSANPADVRAPMTPAEWKALYDALEVAVHAVNSRHDSDPLDWYVLSAARRIAHAHHMRTLNEARA